MTEPPPDNPLAWVFWRRDQKRAAEAAERPHVEQPAGPATPFADAAEPRQIAWLASMLQRSVERLSAATEADHNRNDELNKIAYTLGGIVHLGLDERAARAALYDVAIAIGLTKSETLGTLDSGFGKGVLKPMSVELAERELLNGAVEPIDDGTLADFWKARPLLTHVHDFARARRVSPWALLGVELARAVAVMEPTLVLPPIVSSYGSLNIFVGLVGISGAGKGGAERVAVDAITMPYVETATVGSGEGITHSFVKRNRAGEQSWLRHNMLFSVPEVDTLAAVAGRQGATLLPELRRAWSGESLGFAYADPTKRLIVHGGEYRLSLILGIQPGRARALLDDADGGTPQRFVWLPAVDREAPAVAPVAPERQRWSPPHFVGVLPKSPSGSHVMGVCELAWQIIDDAALARLHGELDALDGHLLYAQLKVAAALALLDGRLGVEDDDWHLADTIMRVSRRTREAVTEALQAARRATNTGRAEAEADRSFVVADKAAERAADHEERASQRIVTLLQGGVLLPRNELRRGLRHNHRHVFDDALDALLSAGTIHAYDDEKGVRRYALGS